MGNWIPGDPTLVAQILKISSAFTPPPPDGFVSPMTWGVESNVTERFAAAGVPAGKMSFARNTFTFNLSGTPEDFVGRFKNFYGPTMNAFEAAEKGGRRAELQGQLEELFKAQNKSSRKDMTSIPATFLRVTVALQRRGAWRENRPPPLPPPPALHEFHRGLEQFQIPLVLRRIFTLDLDPLLRHDRTAGLEWVDVIP